MRKSSVVLFVFSTGIGLMGLAANLFIVHGYNSQIYGPSILDDSAQAKFVGQADQTRKLDSPTPSFLDTTVAYFNMMTGRSIEKPKTGLQKFKKRQTQAENLNTPEGVIQETAFWTGVASQFGIGGQP